MLFSNVAMVLRMISSRGVPVIFLFFIVLLFPGRPCEARLPTSSVEAVRTWGFHADSHRLSVATSSEWTALGGTGEGEEDAQLLKGGERGFTARLLCSTRFLPFFTGLDNHPLDRLPDDHTAPCALY